MRSSARDEQGLVGVILTIVIVFALIAVVQLTRTLEAAQQINTRVLDITGSVKGANSNLNTGCDPAKAAGCTNALPVLSETESIVTQIDAAAKPLSGEAGQVLGAANNINTSASAILATASSINGTVHAINNSVGSINANVNTIGSSISGINADVVAIKGPSDSSLNSGVSGINNRADVIIGLVNGIKGDTSAISTLAGGIQGQAHAISCDHVSLLGLNLVPIGPCS